MYTAGLDVSQRTLDLALVDAATKDLVHAATVGNDAQGITDLLDQLARWSPTLLVLEATGPYHAPVLEALVTADQATALVNPAQVKAFRQTQLGRTKTDRQDARLLAHFAALHHAELRRYQPPTVQRAKLASWVRYRESLVAESTRLKAQQHAAHWQGDPQVQTWIAERLRETQAHRTEIDRQIAALLAEFPEATVLTEMTGVGVTVAATVLGFLPVGVWGQAKAAAAYAGVHPHVEQSGQRSRSWMSKAGHAPLRRVLYMAALAAITHDGPLAAFYQQLLTRGKRPMVALVAVMHKLLRRMMGRLKTFYRARTEAPLAA
jgi:transposase